MKPANLKNTIIASAVCLFLTGCEPATAPDKNIPVYDAPMQQVEGARFTVETAGKFNAGYENNGREILIITDTTTGRKYVGVTGVGVAELHAETQTPTVKLSSDSKTIER